MRSGARQSLRIARPVAGPVAKGAWMRAGMVAALAAMVAAAPGGAEAAATAPIAPAGPWVVHFDANQCLASRSFGQAGNAVTLVLKQPAVGKAMQLALLRPDGAHRDFAEQLSSRIGFDGGPPTAIRELHYVVSASRTRIDSYILDPALIARLTTSQAIAVGFGDYRTGPMTKLMAMMKDCVEDLRKAWNVTLPGEPSAVARPAVGDILSVISSDDYPSDAVSQQDSGTASFVMLIDEKGKIADCTITATSKVPLLDAQACAIVMRRATFTPAVGLDGKPARSASENTIRWVIP